MNIVILDYGSGNLRSAERAVARAAAAAVPDGAGQAGAARLASSLLAPGGAGTVTVTADLAAAAEADGLVVPGVGAFAACMAGVDAVGAGPVIAERVAAGRPVLGICVGMQILFEYGDEHGTVTRGLGLLPGVVTRLAARRVPHMGWNAVDAPAGSALFAGLGRPGLRGSQAHSSAPAGLAGPGLRGSQAHSSAPAALPGGTRFYFVHSYAAHAVADLDGAGALVTTCAHEDARFVAAVERGPLSAVQFHPEKSADAGAVLLRNWVAAVAAASHRDEHGIGAVGGVEPRHDSLDHAR